MKQNKWMLTLLIVMGAMLGVTACSPAAVPAAEPAATEAATEAMATEAPAATEEPMAALSGEIIIDGSSYRMKDRVSDV